MEIITSLIITQLERALSPDQHLSFRRSMAAIEDGVIDTGDIV